MKLSNINKADASIIIITASTILLGVLLGWLQSKIGWLATLVAIFSVTGVYVFLTVLVVKKDRVNQMDNALDINNAVQMLNKLVIQTSMIRNESIITARELVTIEDENYFDEIWLVTSDLNDDADDGIFGEIVKKNLKQGTKYFYFVPDDNRIRTRVEQIKKFNNNHENLKFLYLKNEYFHLIPLVDYVIYNPLSWTCSTRACYMGISLVDNGEKVHIKLSKDTIDSIIGEIQRHITVGDNRNEYSVSCR